MVVEDKKCPLCGASSKNMHCDGSGGTSKQAPDGTWKAAMCPNMFIKRFYDQLDPSLKKAKIIRKRLKVCDYLDENLFIRSASWSKLAPLVKLALIYSPKPLEHTHRVTSDREITGIKLGKRDMSRDTVALTALAGDGDQFHFRDLDDFLRHPKLLILRLGDLGYKNIACPGWVYESVNLRLIEGNPTWIVESPEVQWTSLHLAYSDALDSLLTESFKEVTLKELRVPA